MNRIIHTLSTSRTALNLLLATLLTATAAQTATAQPSGNWADEGNRATTVPQSEDGSTLYISTAEQLACYAYGVNNDWKTSGSASGYYCGRTVELMADIDLSAHYWKPIGWNKYYYFNGYFHGNGHVITGIHVNGDPKSDYTGNIPCYGLFGYLNTRDGGTSTITDLVLKDFSITASYSGNNSDQFYLGGLVGRCDGNTAITNCLLVNGSVSKSVMNSHAHIGKVAGGGSPSTATANYYHNVSVSGWNDGVESYALQTIGGETEACAVALTISSTHGNVALGGTMGRISDGIIYAPANETVTLNTTTDAGYIASLAATGLSLTSGQFTMPDNDDGTIAATISIDPAQFSQDGDTYTIKTAGGWNVFCDLLAENTKGYFTGKTVVLANDITVTRMAGGDSHDFTGTFDGGGKTLTVSISSSDSYAAPFREIMGATIRNLKVSGSVSGTKHSAGLVSYARGVDSSVENTIENCLVATDISTIVDTDGDCYLGGIVGHGFNCKLTIRGCAFTGSLTSESNYTGGLQGWSDGNTLILEDDIFAATSVNAANVGFHPIAIHANNASTTATVTNVYYTVAPTCTTASRIAAAGKATRTVAAGTDVTIEAVALTGTPTQYTVSGITAYSGGGLQRGETLYYGSDDQLSLTLTTSAMCDQPGYQYAYTASAGTLSGTTLTMPDEDVTISVNTAALAPIDWATVNQGTSADPYMIYNKDQLLLLAHRVNGTNGETTNDYEGKYFKLGADITFDPNDLTLDEGQSNYVAIGSYIGDNMLYFKGNFDGDGHTVSGIRIRKDGNGNADFCQGLFGLILSGADIHDVHLTDARITGYQNVGGIAGYNDEGCIMRCSVTDSYITATNNANYGTICGGNLGTLTNNYYHGCTVSGTAVTSGVGCQGADIAANNGALPAYAITFGDGVSTTALASAPENGFVYNGVSYYREGLALPLASTLGSEAPEGYTLSFSANGTALSGNTYTVNATDGDVTINTTLRSDGQQHEVSYMTADGTPDKASAIALDGTETNLAAGWYYVGNDISYNATLTLGGDVHLILADGCEMKVGESDGRISGRGISGYSKTLDIYAQSLGDDMGALSIYNSGSNNDGIYVKALTVNGGNITADANGSNGRAINATTSNITVNGGTVTANSANSIAISSGAKIYINGGTVNATGGAQGISGSSLVEINGGTVNATCTGSGYGIRASGSLAINGGNVTASSFYAGNGTITLGWTKPTDRITASNISTGGGTVAVKDGQALTDGSGHIYTGTLSADDLAALAGKTLQPCLVLNETDGVTPLAALVGQANVPVIFTRTFSANVASTICLPFAISADQATAAGKFYSFAGVNTSGSDWVVTMQEADPSNLVSGELAANTPYLFMPSVSNDVTFSATIATVASSYTASTTPSTDNVSGWTFCGTYETIEWESDPGNVYGFASGQAYGNSGDQTEAGKFIRVHTGGIRPFRAYLQYSGSGNARAMSGSASSNELPETMTVRLIGADGQTSAIGTLDTRTGEATFGGDAWYTLDGRRLSGKPAAKGLYIKNGKKTVIK